MRRLGPDDIVLVMDIMRPYFYESSLLTRGTYDEQAAVVSFLLFLNDPDTQVWVHPAGGLFVLCLARLFTVEVECGVEMFYVPPGARGTRCARDMVEKIDEICRENDVLNCYVVSQSAFADGGKNAKLFKNLFGKSGFFVIGDSLAKGY